MKHICDYPDSHIVRTFDIAAISLPIVYNKYVDHDPNGLLYVLKEDAERIEREARKRFRLSPPQPYEEVQPLVLRANVGDEIRINFYNRLNRRASLHVQGLEYDVLTSDGASIGCNPDTTAGGFIQYTWYATKEGSSCFPTWRTPAAASLAPTCMGFSAQLSLKKRALSGSIRLQERP